MRFDWLTLFFGHTEHVCEHTAVYAITECKVVPQDT